MLAIGIPSYCEAETIGFVTRQIDAGLCALADPGDCVIVNIDSESPDGTPARFLDTDTACPKVVLEVRDRPRGKGRNLRRFFEYCVARDVTALATIDADIESITPAWPAALLSPVLAGDAEFVSPEYRRSRFRATTTNHLAYPLIYGWFGADMRQPIGGDFGLSRQFAESPLEEAWEGATLGFGIDLFISTRVASEEVRWRSAWLGEKSDQFNHTGFMDVYQQVLCAAIDAVRRSPPAQGPLPPPRAFDAVTPDRTGALSLAAERRFLDSLEAAYSMSRGLALPGETAHRLDNARIARGEGLSAESWTRFLVDELVVAAEHPDVPAELFARRLLPPIMMRTLTFWRAVAAMTPDDVEREVRLQALAFRERVVERAGVLPPT